MQEAQSCLPSDFLKRSKSASTPWQKRLAALSHSMSAKPFSEHLDDLEDIYIAEQELADIRAGRVKTVPLEEVMKDLGMVD